MAGTLILLIVAFVLVTVVTSALQSKSNWSNAFERISQRYGGWFSPVRLFRLPAAMFTYKQASCRVRCVRRKFSQPRKSTEFRISWPIQNLRMEIRDVHLPSRMKGRNMQTLGIGDEEFLTRFTIESTNPALAEKLLSPGVRWQLDQLQRMETDHNLLVTIDRNWMTIATHGFIRNPDRLDDFVRYSLELFDQFMLTTSEGIEFHDNVISAVEEMQCPVCSCDIESQMVICVRCKTPHCHECWQYNGKCGMYACDETRYSMVGGSNVPS